ncbi:MAG: hypothetical protein ABI053_01215 [Lacisediminihabitans sp.]
MTLTTAIATCVLLGLLALFQIALASGAPLGEFAWGGQAKVLPTRLRIGSIVSIFIYAAIALIILERAGPIQILGNAAVVQVAAWVVFAYFVLGILMNAISRSKKERYTMTPVVIVLAALSLAIALG